MRRRREGFGGSLVCPGSTAKWRVVSVRRPSASSATAMPVRVERAVPRPLQTVAAKRPGQKAKGAGPGALLFHSGQRGAPPG